MSSIKKIKRIKRFVRNWPYIEKFTDLWFPIISTFIFTLIIYFILDDVCSAFQWPVSYELLITIMSGMVFGIIIFFVQAQFFHNAFTPALSEFISTTKNKHPVTQLFASELLKNFLTTDDHKFFNIFTINQRALSGLTSGLEDHNAGVKMTESSYALLLTKSIEFLPSQILATWDTKKVSLDDEPSNYQNYFDELSKAYKLIKDKTKKPRIFIFENETKFKSKEITKMWGEILEKHKAWEIDKIYYCYVSDFINMRKNIENSIAQLDDFVYFECGRNFHWLITRDHESEKVYLLKNKGTITFVKKFYNQLISFCTKHEQIIEI